jgi:hypothetical protein
VLVIWLVGAVALLTATGMCVVALAQVIQGADVVIPNPLATTCIASLTGLAGLLSPNTGLTASARSARHAAVAGQAAATAVMEHEALHDIAVEADGLSDGKDK